MRHAQQEIYWIVAMILFFLERDVIVDVFLFLLSLLYVHVL